MEGSGAMKSLDNLREWADGLRGIWLDPNDHSIIVTTCDDMPPSIDCVNLREHVNEILDGIDREVEERYTPLPVDADGVPIHVGDVMDEQLPFGGYAAPAPVDTMELSRGAGGYGWMVRLDSESGAFINPKLLRHHRARTVEDVLREFTRDWCNAACAGDMTNAERDAARANVIAEYAAKLTLRGDE